MPTISKIWVIFSTSVMANMSNIEEQLKLYEDKLVTRTDGLRGTGVGMKTGFLTGQMEKINRYGCWCYFQNDHGRGKGTPVNEIDGYCRVLHDGYECAIRDALDEGDEFCEPWTVDYHPAWTLGSTDPDSKLRVECEEKNDNNCAIRACLVEGHFVLSLINAFFSTIPFDPTKSHAEGFAPKEECVPMPGVLSEKSCCGYYPNRMPFKTFDGSRACCGEKTYNAIVNSCCDDGEGNLNVAVSCS